jgi:carbon monoxide dehydrogenase subunit G
MKVSASIVIDSSPEKVWKLVTDFKNSAEMISAIDKIDVLEEPEKGLVGFKWKETRTMMGKQATEVMWVTDVEDGRSYRTRAESHGSVYLSGLSVSEENGKTRLTQTFEGQAQSFGAKLMNGLLGWMIKGSTRKAFEKDLADIKRVAEAKN